LVANMELLLCSESTAVPLAAVRGAPSYVVPAELSPKLAGCTGALISAIFPPISPHLVGVLIASDGLVTQPILASELVQGVLLHTAADGSALSNMRAWFPPGIAVQPSPCKTHVSAVNVKGVIACVVVEKDVADALAMSEARIISHMNTDHADSLVAFARVFGGLPDAGSTTLTGVNVAGFSMCVTLSKSKETSSLLVRYSRPVRAASEIRSIAVEMHQAAYSALGLRYRLSQGYYLKTVAMAMRELRRGLAARQLWLLGGVALLATALVAQRRIGQK